MNPPNSTTTWPKPVSPLAHQRAEPWGAPLSTLRTQGLAEYKLRAGRPTPPPSTDATWQPQNTGAIRTRTPVTTAKHAPRHARIPLPAVPRDAWVRWTVLDLPLAALPLLILAATATAGAGTATKVRKLAANQVWSWYAELLLMWVTLNEPRVRPLPRHARVEVAPSWTVDTGTLNTVVTEWTAADTAARIGAGR